MLDAHAWQFEVRLPTILPEFDDAFRQPSAPSSSKTLSPKITLCTKFLLVLLLFLSVLFTSIIDIC
jgi:hypothetical protein